MKELDNIREKISRFGDIIEEKNKQIHTIESERKKYSNERGELLIELKRKTTKTRREIETLVRKMGFVYNKRNVYVKYISFNLEYNITLNHNFDGDVIAFILEQRYNKRHTSRGHFNIYHKTLQEIEEEFGDFILTLIKDVDI